MKSLATLWLGCAVSALCATGAPVWAQSLAVQPAPAQAAAAGAGASTPAGDLFQKPVATDRLNGYRGGTDTVHNSMKLTGTASSNTAIGVTTGSNAISAGAFASMSGLPVVIQNSGANVLIQNAVILHLEMN